MSVEVVMPQMGESITEGTVSKWLKAIGDRIERDEPILEISTDKVDAEVPAPGAGVLLEIRSQEGETVEVGAVVAIIGEEGESAASNGSQTTTLAAGQPAVEEAKPIVEAPKTESVPQPQASVAARTPPETPQSNNEQKATSSAQATEVVMPQMGESITEGTVSKWLKAVGDRIEKDEPLLEISTDKVDAEVPSPSAGTLLEIRAQEGETVEVGSIVALVGAESAFGSQTSSAAQAQAAAATAEATGADAAQSASAGGSTYPSLETEQKNIEETEGRSYDYGRPGAVEDAQTANGQSTSAQSANGQSTNGKTSGEMTLEDLRKTKSSPLVRNIAREHGIDISRIEGSGMSGRVTKKDILSFIESGAALRPQDLLRTNAPVAPSIAPVAAPQTVSTPAPKAQAAAPPVASAVGDRVEPMSVMRRKIAEHMTFSKQTSAHVTSVYEIDMTNVARFRDKNKAEFQSRYGTKLTFMPFIFQATTTALRKFPIVNSQVAGDQIVYKGDVNLGMAVALDW
ncbi:MAG TPA: biotin/lipoyl-containing protein, partial [Pyrinomonadaceae bacterium]